MDLSLAEKYFHLSADGAEQPLLSYPAERLLEPEPTLELLQTGSAIIKGIGLELAVSFAGLAYFGLIGTKLYAMAAYNRSLDLSLSNVTVQLESHGDHAHLWLKVGEWRWLPVPEDPDARDAFERSEWESYFRWTINPLIESTAACAGFKSPLIWNQYGARLAFFRNFVRDGDFRQEFRDRFEQTVVRLMSLPAETFGRRVNPFDFAPTYLDNPYRPGERMIIRSSCCMYYKREGGSKCYNCPILKEADRARMRETIAAAST